MHGTIKPSDDEARELAYSTPLDQFDVGNPELFRNYTFWPYFERLRKEAPVHYCRESMFGPYWSLTKYNDIMEVETNHAAFSSAAALGGISIRDQPVEFRRASFIAMDQPHHGPQRKTVAPMFTPTHLDELAINIRKRSAEVLDHLPLNETFDWVDKVSIELTTQMLAVLFDFPWEERRKLTRWSDVSTAIPGGGVVDTEEAKQAELMECGEYFGRMWDERIKQPPKSDLLSMMAHSPATRHLREGQPAEFSRQPDAADRRWQRHDAQHALRQRRGAERESRSIQEAARESRADRKLRSGSDPLADAARPHAPDGA